MTTFFERLDRRARDVDSLLCVGIDPHPEDLAQQTGQAALEFGRRLVDATSDLALCYKPNSAFFEALGPAGTEALARLLEFIPDEIPVLLDAKRGDIGSTAKAYARAAFDVLGADALTINPYLGRDAIAPFIARPDKGAFLLCKTSNPGSADLQDLDIQTSGGSVPIYVHIAQLARRWNSEQNLGLVVGATFPEALARVRAAFPETWILAPGVGAQGGALDDAVRAGMRADGLGVIVTVSRGISRAADPRAAAASLRQQAVDAVSSAQTDASVAPPPMAHGALADALLDSGCVRFGEFTLKSGLTSPIYIDLRRLVGSATLMDQAAHAYVSAMRPREFDVVAALPYAALPIGTAVALRGDWPLVYPRREAKAYGTGVTVEGVYEPGQRAIVLDDLATTGGSKVEAIEKLRAVDLEVSDIVVLIDRESGARETLTEAGYQFHAVFTLSALLDRWRATGRIDDAVRSKVLAFLAASRQGV